MTRLTTQSECFVELSAAQQEVISGGKGLLDLSLDLDLSIGGKKRYYGRDKKQHYGYDKKQYYPC